MNTIELKLGLPGNDTTYYVDYSPDTGIEEVRASESGEPALIDTTGYFVTVGDFPLTKMVTLIEELTRLAAIEFAEHHEEWLEGRREAGREYRQGMYDE